MTFWTMTCYTKITSIYMMTSFLLLTVIVQGGQVVSFKRIIVILYSCAEITASVHILPSQVKIHVYHQIGQNELHGTYNWMNRSENIHTQNRSSKSHIERCFTHMYEQNKAMDFGIILYRQYAILKLSIAQSLYNTNPTIYTWWDYFANGNKPHEINNHDTCTLQYYCLES
jgi:hypothetical protein